MAEKIKFVPFNIHSSRLEEVPIVQGQVLFVKDTREILVDFDGENRIPVGSAGGSGDGESIGWFANSNKKSIIFNDKDSNFANDGYSTIFGQDNFSTTNNYSGRLIGTYSNGVHSISNSDYDFQIGHTYKILFLTNTQFLSSAIVTITEDIEYPLDFNVSQSPQFLLIFDKESLNGYNYNFIAGQNNNCLGYQNRIIGDANLIFGGYKYHILGNYNIMSRTGDMIVLGSENKSTYNNTIMQGNNYYSGIFGHRNTITGDFRYSNLVGSQNILFTADNRLEGTIIAGSNNKIYSGGIQYCTIFGTYHEFGNQNATTAYINYSTIMGYKVSVSPGVSLNYSFIFGGYYGGYTRIEATVEESFIFKARIVNPVSYSMIYMRDGSLGAAEYCCYWTQSSNIGNAQYSLIHGYGHKANYLQYSQLFGHSVKFNAINYSLITGNQIYAQNGYGSQGTVEGSILAGQSIYMGTSDNSDYRIGYSAIFGSFQYLANTNYSLIYGEGQKALDDYRKTYLSSIDSCLLGGYENKYKSNVNKLFVHAEYSTVELPEDSEKTSISNGAMLGKYNILSYDNQVIIGLYNQPEDALFLIGNGVDNNNRLNGLKFDKENNLSVQGRIKSNTAITIPLWQTGVTYTVNDLILYNGQTYLCTIEHESEEEFAEENWSVIASGSGSGTGEGGPAGKSVYEIAVEEGFSGDKAAWLESLKGDTGEQGIQGDTGAPGKSAYQIAIDNGFDSSKSEVEWLESLKGETGAQGPIGETGPQGPAGPEGTITINTDCAIVYAIFSPEDWEGSEAPYSQTVEVNGITESNYPIVDIKLSNDATQWESEQEAFSCLDKIITGNGSITAYCNEKPEVEFSIKMRVAGDLNSNNTVSKTEFTALQTLISNLNTELENILNGEEEENE